MGNLWLPPQSAVARTARGDFPRSHSRPVDWSSFNRQIIQQYQIAHVFDNISKNPVDPVTGKELDLQNGIEFDKRGLTTKNTTGKTTNAQVASDLRLAKTDPFTILVEIWPRDVVSLAGVFGLARSDLSAAGSAAGTRRDIITFNGNYYFWSGGADWDTGITFDSDGNRHVVAFVSDGANLTFYRDGVAKGSTAVPAGWVTPTATESYVIFAGSHSSATDCLNIDIGTGLIATKAFSAAEVKAWSDYSYLHRKPANQTPYLISIPDAAPATGIAPQAYHHMRVNLGC